MDRRGRLGPGIAALLLAAACSPDTAASYASAGGVSTDGSTDSGGEGPGSDATGAATGGEGGSSSTTGSPSTGVEPTSGGGSDTGGDPAGTGTGSGSGGTDPTGGTTGSGVEACGDGVREGAEECDGTDFGGQTCAGLGFASGELRCTQLCTLDFVLCTQCGNDLIEGLEDCDGTALGGIENCEQIGIGSADELVVCTDNCTYDFSGCSGCGDGVAAGAEDCDGADLQGADCVDLGFDQGVLSCSPGCTYDSSMCSACGNGVIEGGENCDSFDFGGASCGDFSGPGGAPFDGGILVCDQNCNVDLSQCWDCGDGSISGAEACDGANLLGLTCRDFGFTEGALGCAPTCTEFDTSGCTTCGDGAIEGAETCDGANLGGETCSSLGFDGGVLACSPITCTLDTSGCISNACGDGMVLGGEECDCGADGTCTPAELGEGACTDLPAPGGGLFNGGTLACLPGQSCSYDTVGCTYCGDGTVQAASGEDCEPSVPLGLDCTDPQFGNYGGGSLACTGCMYDTSSCTLCGNDVLDAGEVCDADQFGAATCEGEGFPGGGSLGCNTTCTALTTSGCFTDTCGNGVLDVGEACDASASPAFPPAGDACDEIPTGDGGNYASGGTLGCTPSCTLDLIGCDACGNGVINTGEECDTTVSVDCEAIGEGMGPLSCTGSCSYDTSMCSLGTVCGSDPAPSNTSLPSAPCDPSLSTTETCVIACDEQAECKSETLTCPAGYRCDVRCTERRACDGATLNCPDGYACDLVCSGFEACENLRLNCNGYGLCALDCTTGTGAQRCKDIEMYCENGDCSKSCHDGSPQLFCGGTEDCTCVDDC